MPTRTSSPPGSRSTGAATTGSGSTRAGTSTSAGKGSGKGSSKTSSKTAGRSGSTSSRRSSGSTAAKRPAPRAVRNGPGPVSRAFGALGHALKALWLGVAHALGAVVRRIGSTARDLEPEHRRDGLGLLLIGLAVVVAGAVWWQLPGAVGEAVRTVVNGSVGLVGWFVPLALLGGGAVTMRNPAATAPAGRQVVGWAALLFGVLGLVHLAHGSPRGSDTAALREAGGAIGFVVGSLAMGLLHSAYVVVPLLLLLAFFGVLVITATPLYRVPDRLVSLRDRLLGRGAHGTDGAADADLPPHQAELRTSPAKGLLSRRSRRKDRKSVV